MVVDIAIYLQIGQTYLFLPVKFETDFNRKKFNTSFHSRNMHCFE